MRRSPWHIAGRWHGVWLLLAMLGAASRGHAQGLPDEPAPSRPEPAPVIVAQQGRVADQLVRRIGAELDALGIPSQRSNDLRRTVAQLERQRVSAIVIEVQKGAIWIWAPAGGKLQRKPVVGRRDELPLAAVERVRALRRVGPSMTALAVLDPEPPPSTTATARAPATRVAKALVAKAPIVRRTPRPTSIPGRWTLGVSAGLLGSAGMGAGATLSLDSSYRWRSWLELDASVIAPLGAASRSTTAGTVDVYAALARIGLALTTDAWGALRPSVGLGLGALLLGLQGAPALGFEANDSWRVGLAPHVELRLVWRVQRRLTVTLTGLLGSALPRVTVSAGAKDLDRWGQPFYSLLGGLALRL